MRVNKKRNNRFVVMLLIVCIIALFSVGRQVSADENTGGNITTPGKITFEVEETKSTTVPTTGPSKEKEKEFFKVLPKTGESNSFLISFSGMMMLMVSGCVLYVVRMKSSEGGEK